MSPDTVAQGSQKGRNNYQDEAGHCEESTYPENQREKILSNQRIKMKQMILFKIVMTKIMEQKCLGGQVDLYTRTYIIVSGLNPVADEIYHSSLFREFQQRRFTNLA